MKVPPSVDERQHAQLLIAIRRGQRAFRQGLLLTFDGTRCISASRVEEDCAPQQDALELTWFTPLEARDPAVLAEFENGQSTLLLQALAHLGV
jgi:hypothetical protein